MKEAGQPGLLPELELVGEELEAAGQYEDPAGTVVPQLTEREIFSKMKYLDQVTW